LAAGAGFSLLLGILMSESQLYGEILRALSRDATRLFRQQSGLLWSGQVISHSHNRLILANPRAVRVGTPGIADLGGLTSVIVTPDMVGQRIAIDVQLEVKYGRGRATAEQANYIAAMQALGGRAGIVRSVEEAQRIILADD
jgi:hypothetical protein